MRISTRRCGWLALALIVTMPLTAGAGADEKERPAGQPEAAGKREARAVLATSGAGVQPVFFVPQDNDANATVVFLYNTTAADVTVSLRGFGFDGSQVYSLDVPVPAHKLLRLVSDSVAASPPPSWDNTDQTNVVVTNFTDFTQWAALFLPNGVKVDGYVEWNPGTGVVDPRAAAGRVPLRFSVGGDAP